MKQRTDAMKLSLLQIVLIGKMPLKMNTSDETFYLRVRLEKRRIVLLQYTSQAPGVKNNVLQICLLVDRISSLRPRFSDSARKVFPK